METILSGRVLALATILALSGCGKVAEVVPVPPPPRIELKIERESKVLIEGQYKPGSKASLEVYEAVLGLIADGSLK